MDQSCKSRLEVAFGAGVQNMELEPEGAGRSLHVARGGLRKRRIGRINKQRHDRRCRHQFVQEPQPLCRKFAAQAGRARHVAAWAVEAGDNSKRNRIAPSEDDDWNRSGGSLRRQCRGS